jgi:hypothetical protein
MAWAKPSAPRPRRLCGVYFPYGVSLPNAKNAEWNWFPTGEGREFQFNQSLLSLEPLRKEVTILGGLSHPQGRRMGGHDTGDIFLTAARLKGSQFVNSISLDQFAAERIGQETRFPSLALSSDGGVGEPTRSSTLSFNREGQPVPALSKPRQVFERLFTSSAESIDLQRRQLAADTSMLDLILENSRSLRRQLGKLDQRKLDEYLASVREIEKRVARSQKWLDTPRPKVDAEGLHLDADDHAPQEFIQTMYDLIYLAFQTDTTRFATFQLGSMNGATSIAGKFPELLGLGKNHHGLAHGAGKPGGAEALGKWDRFLAEQLAYFLTKLKQTPEGDGNLLDQTLVFYGSSNSKTHNNTNYPLVLAGGGQLGMKHGQYLRFNAQTPLSNLFATMLQRLGVETSGFGDSTGELTEVLS